jgi:hypothetical protein
MFLDLGDIRAKIVVTPDDRMRLTIDYPCLPAYRERIMAALSDLLKPNNWGVEFPELPLRSSEGRK